jgi:hypothetical protein
MPKVVAQIKSGLSSLNSGNYSDEELEVFEKVIKSETH